MATIDFIWVSLPTDARPNHPAECERLLHAKRANGHPAALPSLAFIAGDQLPAEPDRFRCYNHFRLREVFKLMGGKLQSSRHGPDELTERVFDNLRLRLQASQPAQPAELAAPGAARTAAEARPAAETDSSPPPATTAPVSAAAGAATAGEAASSAAGSLGGMCAVLSRADYTELVLDALLELHYTAAEALVHFCVASDLKERRRCLILLFGGTSGSGKSTLASLMASRLGISTVISTDSIRNMMRGAQPDNEVLLKSTYTAGDALAIDGSLPPETPRKKRVLRGYKAQAALLQEAIERVVCSHEARQVSLIMEGVHLDVRFIMSLLSRHPAVVPFLIYISNEQKHRERFAVRSQHMTSAATLMATPVPPTPLATAALTAAAVSPTAFTPTLSTITTLSTTTLPTATVAAVAATALTASAVELRHNRYLANFEAIRMIQRYLVKHADSCLLPKVDNTNVDRSVATIHSTLLGCLARTGGGASLFDPATEVCSL